MNKGILTLLLVFSLGGFRALEPAGIKVHGRWLIEVRNPDGSLVSRNDFENGFVGQDPFRQLLTRSAAVGFWTLTLTNGSGPGGGGTPCTGEFGDCRFAEAAMPSNNLYDSKNLVVDVPSSGPNAGRLVLSGSLIIVGAKGNFRAVTTENHLCTASGRLGSGQCSSGGSGVPRKITTTNLASVISVVAGQVIQVTVVISFS